MHLLYSVIVEIAWRLLPILGIFSPKLKSFVKERGTTFHDISNWKKTQSKKPVLWAHCASLGEFEMIVPILTNTNIKDKYEVVVSFFSSSGYNHAKTEGIVSAKFYLPIDRKGKMKELVKMINPSVYLLSKYDFWLNKLEALNQTDCHKVLVNALFTPKHFIHAFWAKAWRINIQKFDKIFVQNEESKLVLNSLQISRNVEVVNDLRYDRVVQLQSTNHQIEKVDRFVGDQKCIILGSSWPIEESMAHYYLNNSKTKAKFIIAPHDISLDHINKIKEQFNAFATCLFSQDIGHHNAQVMILDTIGHLSSVYRYGTIAFIGGGFEKGLHNILEAAVYGLPIITGPNIDKFPEALLLKAKNLLTTVTNQHEFTEVCSSLQQNQSELEEIKTELSNWFAENTGQSKVISNCILSLQNY